MVTLTTLFTWGLTVASTVSAFSSYPNEFIRVNYTMEGNWNQSTLPAQETVVAAAEWWARQGPWSVTSKTILPPTNNTHDYLSWRPYFWPDCSNVGNTTELPQEVVWTSCNYVRRDGLFNPDVRMVNDTGAFQAMSDAVFYNTMAWRITKDSKYSANAANFISTWFINPDTYMTPHLDYAQTLRGPTDGTPKGSHTGVLDLKGMAKVASGILVLRAGGAAEWTSDLDTKMNQWCTQYIQWLTTSPLALEEKAALNNHGSFYFTQLAAIQVIVGDYGGARKTLEEYFGGIYLNQIVASGEQPLEADRTRPYHYRAYNAAAITTNSRIAEYIGYDTWNITTSEGATVQTAVDFAMQQPAGQEDPTELYPPVAAVAAHYGDPTGKYAAWLAQKDPQYPSNAWFFYNQPLSDSGIKVTGGNEQGSTTEDQNGDDSGSKNNAATSVASRGDGWLLSTFMVLVGSLVMAF
ncbi:hypothetical protein FRC03_011176 [Tulasnella sp. 419]|nr:hypothetical protein FRC02_004427 [Tulasnella sp. 418]KAG8970158.1 hypothetical protein FRC03_011176 [Tulasnella sp. 419]